MPVGSPKKLMVLDTNVLVHDPLAPWSFAEHDVCLLLVVIEELDGLKESQKEMARFQAQTASRALYELRLCGVQAGIDPRDGIPLKLHRDYGGSSSGRLHFFPLLEGTSTFDVHAGQRKNDNVILNSVLEMMRDAKFQEKYPGGIEFITKDRNASLKTLFAGITTSDYLHDYVQDEEAALRGRIHTLEPDFLVKYGVMTGAVHPYHIVEGSPNGFSTGDYVVLPPSNSRTEPQCLYVREHNNDRSTFEELISHFGKNHALSHVVAKNPEQNIAMNVLCDPRFDAAVIAGGAGSGKTLLAIAAGLHLTMQMRAFDRVRYLRSFESIGRDHGYLKGDLDQKLEPWESPINNALRVIAESAKFATGKLRSSDSRGESETDTLVNSMSQFIEFDPVSFDQGATWTNEFVIIDEAQNFSLADIRALSSRLGHQSKLVLLGNTKQIRSSAHVNSRTSGLTLFADKMRGQDNIAIIQLVQVLRSRFAGQVEDLL